MNYSFSSIDEHDQYTQKQKRWKFLMAGNDNDSVICYSYDHCRRLSIQERRQRIATVQDITIEQVQELEKERIQQQQQQQKSSCCFALQLDETSTSISNHASLLSQSSNTTQPNTTSTSITTSDDAPTLEHDILLKEDSTEFPLIHLEPSRISSSILSTRAA